MRYAVSASFLRRFRHLRNPNFRFLCQCFGKSFIRLKIEKCRHKDFSRNSLAASILSTIFIKPPAVSAACVRAKIFYKKLLDFFNAENFFIYYVALKLVKGLICFYVSVPFSSSLTFLGKAGVYGILKIKLFKLLRRLNNGL